MVMLTPISDALLYGDFNFPIAAYDSGSEWDIWTPAANVDAPTKLILSIAYTFDTLGLVNGGTATAISISEEFSGLAEKYIDLSVDYAPKYNSFDLISVLSITSEANTAPTADLTAVNFSQPTQPEIDINSNVDGLFGTTIKELTVGKMYSAPFVDAEVKREVRAAMALNPAIDSVSNIQNTVENDQLNTSFAIKLKDGVTFITTEVLP